MQKLIIQDIAKVNAYTYAISFRGTEKSLNAIHSILRQQSRNKAYWDDGTKAWIMKLDFLRSLSQYFENAERALVIADRKAAQKQIISLARGR